VTEPKVDLEENWVVSKSGWRPKINENTYLVFDDLITPDELITL
jgi:hypothetical protein